MNTSLKTRANTNGLSSAETDESFTVGANDAALNLTLATVTLTTPLAFAKGDTALIRMTRVGGDAADTAVGTMQFLGATVRYENTGPDGGGAWGITDL